MRLEEKRQCAEGKRQLWGRGQRGGRANAPAAGNGEGSQAIICQAVDVKQAEPIVKAYKEAWVPLIAFLTVCLKTVTALWYGNLKVFALALCEAMEQGKRYLLRTAASLVKVMGGISICDISGKCGGGCRPSGDSGDIAGAVSE
ncbi:MAG: hypothetical protein ACLR0U_19365 [Enterocloster clostridioformis]